jgi:hypothetical protein
MFRNLSHSLIQDLRWRQIRNSNLRNLPSKEKEQIYFASQKLVTPFSGFILSNHYLSKEIDRLDLTWLNPTAKRIKLSRGGQLKLGKGNIIYCQVDQIEKFLHNCIPRIKNPYILITGKWFLPGLIESEVVNSILGDNNLLVWFSQNQIYEHLQIRPFPYGIRLENAPRVLELMNSEPQNKSKNIYVPFAAIHKHLLGSARTARESIAGWMDSEKPLNDYLKKIQHHQWIVSPAGDRPDTYRHWESIALGSIPISVLPKNFKKLFNQSALLVDDYKFIRDGLIPRNECVADDQLALLDYWKSQVEEYQKRVLD